MQTFETYQSCQPSMSSAAGFLAKTFLPQARALALMVLKAAYGGNLPESLRQTGQLSLLLKMSPAEPSAGLMPYVGPWESSATKRYRSRLRQAMLGLRTCDGEYLSSATILPTPSAVSYGNNRGGRAGRVGPIRHSLQSLARHKGGSLCHRFAEAMMGLTRDWTVPDCER